MHIKDFFQDLANKGKAHRFGSPDFSTVVKIPHVHFNTLSKMENKKTIISYMNKLVHHKIPLWNDN